MKMYNLTRIVGTILEYYPATRDDDYLLWLEVLKSVQLYHGGDYLNMPVYEFLQCAKYMKFPHYETVSRVRRKLQETHPELRGTAETQAARAEHEEQYREFARRIV